MIFEYLINDSIRPGTKRVFSFQFSGHWFAGKGIMVKFVEFFGDFEALIAGKSKELLLCLRGDDRFHDVRFLVRRAFNFNSFSTSSSV